MRKYRVLALLLTTAMLLTQTCRAALPDYDYGRDAAGAIPAEGTAPILLEQEDLIFDLNGAGCVTTEYTFRNPTEEPVSLRMLLPLDDPPYRDGTRQDRLQTSVCVDGEKIEATLRHSYYDAYGEIFDPHALRGRLVDGWAEDPFFDPEMTITKYTYQVLAGDSWKGESILEGNERIQVSCALDPVQTTVYLGYVYQMESVENTVALVTAYDQGYYAEEGRLFFLYVMGEPLAEEPVWSVYAKSDPSQTYDVPIQVPIQLVSTEQVPLKDLFCLHWNPEGSVSQSDWYNAVLCWIKASESIPGTLCDLDFDYRLMCWYEYELNFQPGQTLVNSVTTVLYPTVGLRTDPRKYIYTYLLSADRVWNSSGPVNITVNTESYMLDASPAEFEKTDTGYRLTLEQMPEGDLEFTLCASQYPKSSTPTTEEYYSSMIGPALGFLLKATVVVSVLAWLVHLLKKKRKNTEGA